MSIVYRPDQKDIMKYRKGKMGIQAVPGAGKTFIITNLVSDLTVEMHSESDNRKILVLTYMNSACNNFKSRIKKLLENKNIDSNRFEVMTIHSFALKILKENTDIAMVSDESNIIEDLVKNEYIESAIEFFDPDYKIIDSFLEKRKAESFNEKKTLQKNIVRWRKDFFNMVSGFISMLKLNNIDSRELEVYVEDKKKKGESTIMSIVSPIYTRYQELLNSNGYFDYNDILIKAYNILNNNKDIAKKYADSYKYIFEDECQDSNVIQSKIIDLISTNLVRVGDINQSITGTFTGSDPKDFAKFISNVEKSFDMNMASRSCKEIIEIANELIKGSVRNNREGLRPPYIEMVPKGSFGQNPKLDKKYFNYFVYEDKVSEYSGVCDIVKSIKEQNPEYSIGVLLFYNKSVDLLSNMMTNRNIDHEKIGGNNMEYRKILIGIRNLFKFRYDFSNEVFLNLFIKILVSRKVLRNIEPSDIISARMDLNKKYERTLSLLMENFKDNIFRKIFFNLELREDFFKTILDEFSLKLEDLEKFFDDILKFMRYPFKDIMGLFSVASEVLEADIQEKNAIMGISEHFYTISRYQDISEEDIVDSLGENNIRYFDSLLESVFMVGEKDIEPGSVSIATLHKSKGMEWDIVIMPELVSDIFPYRKNDKYYMDRMYLKEKVRYPEAFFKMSIDEIIYGKTDSLYSYVSKLRDETIDEKLRLFYVGVTRAKKGLIVSYYKMREKGKTYTATSPSAYMLRVEHAMREVQNEL